ncbi:MAG: hypothetical protein ACXW18_08785 [Pyrinomonadaceae bacterium]
MKKVNQIIYGVFGALSILIGVVSLMFQGLIISEAHRTIELSHILREGGAAGIFVGLMSIWCIFNYERRAAVHYFLIVFTFLMAAIHWFDYFTGHRQLMSPLINSVPVIVLLVMTIGMKSVRGAIATRSD